MSSTSESSTSSDEIDYQESNLDLSGKVVGNYNIIIELGRGTYSIVWLAYNINNENYYAIKVQHPDDFKDGLEEVKMMKRLPRKSNVFNHLFENFIHTVKIDKKRKKRYLCSVYEVHCGNLDCFIRKGYYRKGFDIDKVKEMFRQLIIGLDILHSKIRVFHGDIKPDNILLKGHNKRDLELMRLYNDFDFKKKLKEHKEKYWESKDMNNFKEEEIKIINNKIRGIVHKYGTELILVKEIDNELRYDFDDKYLDKLEIKISDFGDFCDEDEEFDEDFGTRYYRAPEVILQGECDFKVDIWAAGCVLFELLTGNILFEPDKDEKRSRDYNHLLLMCNYSGKFKIKYLRKTKHYKKFFTKNGDFRHDNICSDELIEVLMENGVEDDNITELVDLFTNIFILNPNKRFDAKKVLSHKWLNS
jgi:serine/threonine-protein kinase SRPK3